MNLVVKRLITVCISLLMLVYVGYQAFAVLYESTAFETVVRHSVYDLLDVQGIAIRNEQVLPRADAGYLYYTVNNGDRVSSGGTIAEVYPSESDAALYREIAYIDGEIETLQTLQKQGTAGKTNLDAINRNIHDTQRDIVTTMLSGDLSGLRTTRDKLLQLLNRKQVTVGKTTDFTARITALSEQRAARYAQYAPATHTVQSPVAGYVVSQVDGYEELLSYPNALRLTADSVRTVMNTTPTVSEGAYVGKVVGDYEWYIACIVPTEKLAHISLGGEMDINVPFVSGDTFPVTVAAINKSGDEAAVILRCDYMSEELSSARCEQVQLVLTEYTGLYVPDAALHFNEENQAGVYVRVGNLLRFRRVETLYYSEHGH